MHLNNAFPHPISDPKYILSDILFYPEVKINTAENQKFGTFLLNMGHILPESNKLLTYKI